MTSTTNRFIPPVGWVLVVLTLSTMWPKAATPQSTGGELQKARLSPMIEQLEQGKVAVNGESWRMIDTEHSPYLLDQVLAKLDAIKKKPNGQLDITPLIRIPLEGEDSPTWMVKQLLDLGALGIVFPAVNTKEQAMRAVRSMRYPFQKGVSKYPNPPGARAGNPRGGKFLVGLQLPELLRRADVWPLNPEGELFAMIMVEKPEGLKNINEILDVPGIGAILLGVHDFAMAFGVAAQKEPHPEVEAAVETVLKACLARKVICGIGRGSNKEENQKLIARGFRILL